MTRCRPNSTHWSWNYTGGSEWSAYALAALPPGECTQYTLDWRPEHKNLSPLPGTELQFLCCPSCAPTTKPPELSYVKKMCQHAPPPFSSPSIHCDSKFIISQAILPVQLMVWQPQTDTWYGRRTYIKAYTANMRAHITYMSP
jgi:hypothetical protein